MKLGKASFEAEKGNPFSQHLALEWGTQGHGAVELLVTHAHVK